MMNKMQKELDELRKELSDLDGGLKKNTFVIMTPPFNIESGGAIALHYLCHLLNKLEENAFVYKWNTCGHGQRRLNRIGGGHGRHAWNKFIRSLSNKHFKNSVFDSSNITKWLSQNLAHRPPAPIKNEIVVYPDSVDGNPLNAKNVVRYLLHKPGFHSNGIFQYGNTELTVGWGKETSGSGYEIADENNLKIIYNMSGVYFQKNFGKRGKTCYMKRKASETKFNNKKIHGDDAIYLDGEKRWFTSHEEIADIFNACHTFICYDPYTHYSTFASMCGCMSIVIPDEGVSKEDWKPNVKDTYGIAYGLDDIEYAKQTKDKFLEYQNEIEQNNIDAVKKFVKLCEEHFVD